jgi:hypothetical protein
LSSNAKDDVKELSSNMTPERKPGLDSLNAYSIHSNMLPERGQRFKLQSTTRGIRRSRGGTWLNKNAFQQWSETFISDGSNFHHQIQKSQT